MFRLERFIEVLEFTYLPVGKYFSCVNTNWYHGEHCPRKLTKVKVWFALWSDTVYVGNQGRDEWYKLSAFCWIVFHIHWSVSFDCIFTTTFSTTIVFYTFFYAWVRQKNKDILQPFFAKSGQTTWTIYLNVHPDILKFSFHNSSTKFQCKRVSNQNCFLGHDCARLTCLVFWRTIQLQNQLLSPWFLQVLQK